LYTDQHPDVKAFSDILRPGYGRYAGIVSDIFMDHFLAANWNEYSIYTLRQFSKHSHAVFLSNFLMLPFKVKQFLPFLIQHKRFESYARRETMFDVLEIMSRHSSLPANSHWAMETLNHEYHRFEYLFRSFFPQITAYIESEYGILIRKPH
jgi:acyl carrier protein phosphodiesterase